MKAFERYRVGRIHRHHSMHHPFRPHLLTLTHTHSHTHSLTHPLSHSLTPSLTHSFIHSLTQRLVADCIAAITFVAAMALELLMRASSARAMAPRESLALST